MKPERPRDPKEMLRPKLVTPHLVIAPRFGFDSAGRYAISRSPMITSSLQGSVQEDHLLFLLGVLNSSACFWDLARRSHIYSHGYSRLELATMKGIRIPNFRQLDQSVARRIIKLVQSRIKATGTAAFQIEAIIDDLVADLYGLSADDRRVVGMLGDK